MVTNVRYSLRWTRRSVLSASLAAASGAMISPASRTIAEDRGTAMNNEGDGEGVLQDSHVRLPDGRSLAFVEIGDRDGYPVFFFHGAPGSRLNLLPWTSEIAARNLRVISTDRPGYGGSSPRSDRTLADVAADTVHLADAMGINRFIAAGHSSGGPYALSCAALAPHRITGTLVLAGVTDMGWAGAWEGFVEPEASLMRLPDEQSVIARCADLFGEDGSRFFDAPGPELPDPDLVLLADAGFGHAMTQSMAEAFRQGVLGYAQDVFAQARPWPLDLRGVAALVIVAHGAKDTFVPLAHSRHTGELFNGASVSILPGHGHISILGELPTLSAQVVHAREPRYRP